MTPQPETWRDAWRYIHLVLPLAKYFLYPVGVGASWVGYRWALSRSTHWPVVWGTVQGYAPVTGGAHAICVLIYTYTVNGEYFSGSMPFSKRGSIRTEDDLRAALPVGTPIEVRVSPRTPSHSVVVIPEMTYFTARGVN